MKGPFTDAISVAATRYSFCRAQFAASFDQVGNPRHIAATFRTKIALKSHELLWQKSHVKTGHKMVFWELPCTTVLDDGAHLSPMCPAFWFRDRRHVWVKFFGSQPLLRVAWGYSYSYSLFTFSQQNQVNVSFDLQSPRLVEHWLVLWYPSFATWFPIFPFFLCW